MANGWTQARRLKQGRLIQGWKPWERSTGAVTLEGKAKSSRNAYKYGSTETKAMLRELKKLLREEKRLIE